MVVGSSQQETLDLDFVLLGTRQQDVPVILKGLMLPNGFDAVSPSFTVRDVTILNSFPAWLDKLKMFNYNLISKVVNSRSLISIWIGCL
ncbi:unnamed protein product [Schistosoma mattheei]|uniref:Uncharacterized protein n=1 Tax=Schistosoma mattheei TaxID=31246 RepID=A0A183PLQ5_9TREM|nr:unnamed protein product [Schistosoma mattheei]